MADPTPWVAASLDDLLAGVTDRVPVRVAEVHSGASFERLIVQNQPCFLKQVAPAQDWTVRLSGNDGWELKAWRAGLYHRAPAVIDHAVIGMAVEGRGRNRRLAILMHDRTEDLVPAGGEPISARRQESFLEHMAAMHAAYEGFVDEIGLEPLGTRLTFLAPDALAEELRHRDPPEVLCEAAEGWRRMADREPDLYARIGSLHRDPEPLVRALRATPQTFTAGDWRLANLGTGPGGETVLLDWAHPGEVPFAWDLVWYLGTNRPRLPEPREVAIQRYRSALEAHQGISTEHWWHEQLDLCLLGLVVCLGWALGSRGDEDLHWWAAAADRGWRRLT